MFRSLGIFILAGVLISVGADRWRNVWRAERSVLEESVEEASLLLDGWEPAVVETRPVELTEPKLISPPPNGLCHVHDVALEARGEENVFSATVDVPARVRATKFPLAPFYQIPARVFVYERPRNFNICGTGLLGARVYDCPACVAAQKEWFGKHPAPEQVVIKVPGEEPSPCERRR